MSTSNHPRRQLNRLDTVKQFLNRHRKASIAVGILIIGLIAGGIGFALTHRETPKEPTPPPVVQTPKAPEPAPKFYSPLTGEEVKTKAATTKPVSAIMIENSPAARPQSGLGSAEVVYEAIAEGGITRFLTLFQQHKPKLIGPVRSVRMYYVDWLAPYNASIFHVGGSLYALREVRNGKYRDLDQFFNDGSYWRSTDRYAPHNVYTNSKRVDALNKAKGYKTSKPQPFKRVDSTPSKKPTATKIDIKISSALYNSHYTYDKKTNLYLRSQGGEPHIDTVSGRIKARVVIVMQTDMKEVMQDGIREDYKTTGKGKAWIFQDGIVKKVSWNKKDRQHQLYFTDKNDKEVGLARGTTWITAVPKSGGVSWQ